MRICLRCGHNWRPRKDDPPVQCPNCKSPYWDKEKLRGEARKGSSVPVRHLVDGGITQRGRAQTAVQIGQREEDSKAVQIRPTPPDIEAVKWVCRHCGCGLKSPSGKCLGCGRMV
jgi:rubrerythrin